MEPATQESRDNYARRGVGKRLKAVFDEMDSKKDGKIDVNELSSFLTIRQYPHKRHEAEAMIWEVDEDDDGKVSWEEFERSYHRCVNDRLAMREPRQLHNIVLFALNAGPQANSMSIEDLSSYVYFEHGSERMVDQLALIFGMKAGTDNDEITLHKFVTCLKSHQNKEK